MSSPCEAPRPERARLLEAVGQAARENSTAAVLLHGAIAARLGLSASDMKALDLLMRLGPLTAGELGPHVGLATASVTSLIDRLERRGYVRREHDTIDRRRVIVTLIPESLTEIDMLFGATMEPFMDLCASYTDEQLETIRDFLEVAGRRAREITMTLAATAERDA